MSNIEIACRVRPFRRGEAQQNIEVRAKAVYSEGANCTFQEIYGQQTTNAEIYKTLLAPLVSRFVEGFNVCLFVIGETNSGRSFSLVGDGAKPGLLQIAMEDVFNHIAPSTTHSRLSGSQTSLQLTAGDFFKEEFKDLTSPNGLDSNTLDLEETPDRGVCLKALNPIYLESATDAGTIIRRVWSQRLQATAASGAAQTGSSTFIQFLLNYRLPGSDVPRKSYLTIVRLAAMENMVIDDDDGDKLEIESNRNKSLDAFARLVKSLANDNDPHRLIRYSESKLTAVLHEELGGNCTTRVLVCLKPKSDPVAILTTFILASDLAKIVNYPIHNDTNLQRLLTQYRSRIIYLQQQLGVGGFEKYAGQQEGTPEDFTRLQMENLQLRERNELLYGQYEDVRNKYGAMNDLSAQLLMTEEEKLKISKMLMEMQMENNRLKEECEALKFELGNRIVQLENDLATMEQRCQHEMNTVEDLRHKLVDVEEDRRGVADKYVALKADFNSLQRAHDAETRRCDELSLELLNLVNGKAAWMQKLENMGDNDSSEMKRVRDMANDKSWRNKPQFGDRRAEVKEPVIRHFSSDERKFRGDLDKLKNQNNLEQRKLEEKITRLYEELNSTRDLAKERQRKAAEAQAQMMAMKSERDELAAVNNRLQHKIKDLKDDFETRLTKYVKDIAKFMDATVPVEEKQRDWTPMRDYVNEMLRDIKRAHRQREEQLSEAAQNYKKRLEDVAKKHEQLIVAYRMLKDNASQYGLADYDFTPSELNFQLTEPELVSQQQQEINRLRDKLEQAQNDLESYKASYDDGGRSMPLIDVGPNNSNSWAALRRELRDFTSNTQQDLEKERADLLSRNSVLDAENKQLQDYIDSHLSKYRYEIDRLRQILADANIHVSSFASSPSSTPQSWRRDYYRK